MKLREALKIEKAENKGYIIDDKKRRIISFGERELKVLTLVLKHGIPKTIEVLKQEYKGDDIDNDIREFVKQMIEMEIIVNNEKSNGNKVSI